MKLVYLASPYSDADPMIMAKRAAAMNLIAGAVLRTGRWLVFSPLSHSAPIANYVGRDALEANGAVNWYDLDLRILAACDELWVVQFDGWRDSEGVRREIDRARDEELRIPVRWIGLDDLPLDEYERKTVGILFRNGDAAVDAEDADSDARRREFITYPAGVRLE